MRVWRGWLGPVAGLAAVFALFAIIGPASFRDWGNIETILRQTAIVGSAALGMTIVIIAGGIDLSVGSIVALCTVIVALTLTSGHGALAAAAAGVAGGLACGFANGQLITRLRVVPFIVTLGTLLLARGLAKGLAREQTVSAPATFLNSLLAPVPESRAWMIVPAGVWITVLLALVVAAILRLTRPGRYFFALGSNEQAARLSGVPVNAVKVAVYTLSGAFAGVAGLLQFSRLTVGDPTVASGLELDVIAAVVIGGGSLSGGEGSVLGSIVGALIMSVIRNGCAQMFLPNWVQEIVTGAIIVLAVALDRLRHRAGEQAALTRPARPG